MTTCQEGAIERKTLISNRGKQLNHLINDISFEDKIKFSLRQIKKALEGSTNPVISSSFGKDSMVLIHLVHRIDRGVKIAFNITGQQFPETIRFYQMISEEWGLDVFEIIPPITFNEIVKKHGWPKESRNSKTGDKRNPACCKLLKEKPMKEFIKNEKIDLNFVGLIGDEGRQRRLCYLSKGTPTYFMKEWKVTKCIPLIWWTEADIWHYHDQYNIPRNPVYEKYGIKRTGCMRCTGHKGWRESIQKVSFPLYQKVTREIGEPTIEDFGKGVHS